MTRIAATLLISISVAASSAAQAPTDFSGTWVMDEKRSGSAAQEGFVGPMVWSIQQTSGTLVLERQRGTTTRSFTYPVQAKAPAPGPTPVAPGADAPGNRAFFDGTRMVLETQQEIQGKTVSTRESLVLSATGQELTVERVLEVEHGYTLKGAKNFSSVKDVFTRRAP